MNNINKEREFDLSSSGNIFKTNLEHAATNQTPYVGPFQQDQLQQMHNTQLPSVSDHLDEYKNNMEVEHATAATQIQYGGRKGKSFFSKKDKNKIGVMFTDQPQ